MKPPSLLLAVALAAPLLAGGLRSAFGQAGAVPPSTTGNAALEESIAQQRAFLEQQRDYIEQQLAAAESLAEAQPEGSTAAELVTVYRQAQIQLEALEQAQESRRRSLELLAQLEARPEPSAAEVQLPELPDLEQIELERLEVLENEAQQRAREASTSLEATRRQSDLQQQERENLPEQLEAYRSQLLELTAQPTNPEASQELQQAQIRRNTIQTARYEAEIAAIEARLDYLQVDAAREGPRERRLELESRAWSERAEELDNALSRRRLAIAEIEAQQANAQADALEESRFAAQAQRIAKLKEVLVTRQRTRDRVEQDIARISRSVELLDERFKALRERYENAGRTNQMGPLLRSEAQQLEDPEDLRRDLESLQPKIILRTTQLLDAEEELARLRKSGPPPDEGEQDAEKAQELYVEEVATWAEISRVLRDLRNKLELELDARQRKLARTNEFAAYVNERVLWVQSAAPIWRWSGSPSGGPRSAAGADPSSGEGADDAALEWLSRDVVAQPVNRVPSLVEAAAWLATPTHWAELLEWTWGDILAQPLPWLLLALTFLSLLLARHGLHERLDVLVDEGQGPAVAVYRPLVECLLVTALLALPIPLLLAFLGDRLSNAPRTGSLLPLSLGLALKPAALLWFQLAFTRISCRPEGLVPSHLHVPGALARRIRRRILLLAAMMVASLVVFRVFAAYGIQAGGTEEYVNTLGRLVFLFLLGLMVFFNHGLRTHGESSEAAEAELQEAAIGEFPKRLGMLFGAGLLLGVALLAVASMLGYVYTASELFDRLLLTLALLSGLLLTLLVAMRLVEITKRRVAVQRLRAKLAAAGAASGAAVEPAAEVEAAKPSLSQVSVQARQLLSTLVGILATIGLYWIWIDVVPALGIFREVELWHVEEASAAADGSLSGLTTTIAVTLADLMLALFWLLVGFVTGKRLPVLVDLLVFERTTLRSGERYAIQAVSRYVLTLIGLALAFATLRIGWNDVQFLAAAVSVGLGFGLQEIFANFVSGLILLFERPVRIGDWVVIGDITGQVARIQIRATTVIDLDRRELIVPNKDFVTSRLINFTLTDSITRIGIPVGIAYGSDTKLARRLLVDCAKRTMGVVSLPAPKAQFLGFGDSSLNFTLFVFLEDRERVQDIRSDLHFKIDEAFRKEGVEISFPQRDLHVRTASGLEHLVELAELRRQERASEASAPGDPKPASPPAGKDETPKGPLG